jgi:hypothetical protein
VTLSSITSDTTLRVAISAPTKIMHNFKEIYLNGNYDVLISGAAGDYYAYFVGSSLLFTSNFLTFLANVPVAFINWNGTSIASIGWELHTSDRNIPDHYWKHITKGMQFVNGLGATYNVQTDNNVDPNDDSVQYFWLGTGLVLDEDIQVNIGTAPFNGVTLGTGLTSTTAASLPIYYYNGTNVTRIAPMSDRTPFPSAATTPFYNATGAPHWNNGGALTAATTGQYVVYWLYASSLIGGSTCFIRPHSAVYSSLALAQAASDSSLNWASFPSPEVKLLHRFIYRVNTGWGAAPTHLCKLVNVADYRAVAGTPVGGNSATSHESLSGRDSPNQHPATAVALDITNFVGKRLAATDINAQLLAEAVNNNVFGLDYALFSDTTPVTSTAITYTTFMSITTATLQAGTYRIGIFFTAASNNVDDTMIKLVLDGVDQVPAWQWRPGSALNRNMWVQGFMHRTFATSTTHTIVMQQAARNVGNTTTTNEKYIEIWRVS